MLLLQAREIEERCRSLTCVLLLQAREIEERCRSLTCGLLLQAHEIEERYLRRQQRRAELEAKRKEREDEKAVEREQRRQRRLAAAATAQRKEAIRGGATRCLSIFFWKLLKRFWKICIGRPQKYLGVFSKPNNK